jgi:hypothetical protein
MSLHKCTKCLKILACKQNLTRHIKTCKYISLLPEHIEEKDEKEIIESFTLVIDKLKEDIEGMKDHYYALKLQSEVYRKENTLLTEQVVLLKKQN